MWFGPLIDRMKKHRVMLLSGWSSLVACVVAVVMFFSIPHDELLKLDRVWFWMFIVVLLAGCVVELMRNLALATTVTLLVPQERHAQANGLVGTVQGIAFIATSVLSGISVGHLGMGPTMVIAMGCTAIPLVHLMLLRIPEPVVISDPTLGGGSGRTRSARCSCS